MGRLERQHSRDRGIEWGWWACSWFCSTASFAERKSLQQSKKSRFCKLLNFFRIAVGLGLRFCMLEKL
uniref:Uncharacterized protein n=1 Tax=mine drainage metagenome TaxID=410659 RepID=E6QMW1_9ZZZZ